MRRSRITAKLCAALAMTALWAGTAGATTMVRQGLDRLTDSNELVVVGKVLDIHSYWNDDHSFILTDVRFRPSQLLKGEGAGREITVTLLGGTVGDITTLIVAGPELDPGAEYLLFLSREQLLPTLAPRLAVRDLAQGIFDVVDGPGGRRAFSQAIHHPLVADEAGLSDPPGGAEGLALDDILGQIRSRIEE
jgi:hypothetical protein